MSNKTILKPINFSNGIRADEIQSNFNILQEQINNERLSVGGSGISHGLDMVIDGFQIKIQPGTFIDNDGNEVHFQNESVITIEKPFLTQTSEVLTAEAGEYESNSVGIVYLQHEPYAPTRDKTIEFYDNLLPILVKELNSDTAHSAYDYRVIKQDGRDRYQLILPANLINKSLVITYHYAQKRYDLIYIKEISGSYEIGVSIGTPSASPSIPNEPANCKFVIGTVLVDPITITPNGTKTAALSTSLNKKSYRNIYTDSNNNLHIGGVPFNNIKFIRTEEPTDPEEDTIWFDYKNNKLKVWKTILGVSQWISVNDMSFAPIKQCKIWTPAMLETNHNLQEFIFDPEEDLNMFFAPGLNCLEIIVDQIPLHSDQFEEIISNDDDEYVNKGIGFRLSEPLDRPGFVEARVTHYVNYSNYATRFQKTNTFSVSSTVIYDESMNGRINTDYKYRYQECQLDVFINGSKIESSNIIEGTDLTNPVRGQLSQQFGIPSNTQNGSVIEYKITSTIYSYDHIDQLITDSIRQAVEEANERVVGLKWQDAVVAEENQDPLEALREKHPSPSVGDAVTVANLDEVYTWDGEKWVRIFTTVIPMASENTDGKMSKEDKIKLNNADTKLKNVYTKDEINSMLENIINMINSQQ